MQRHKHEGKIRFLNISLNFFHLFNHWRKIQILAHHTLLFPGCWVRSGKGRERVCVLYVHYLLFTHSLTLTFSHSISLLSFSFLIYLQVQLLTKQLL